MRLVTQLLDEFLDGQESGVVAVKGAWGVGKTYFIKKYLAEKTNIQERLMSYVSLFGISSIDEVRRQIIPSAISAKALRNEKAVKTIQKLLALSRKLPKVADFEHLFQAIENEMSRNLIIVFDDIERKDAALSMSAFLGLANLLSEHAHCKVIIILNEDQLGENDTRELSKFREKLIEREILFEPTYEDNAAIFFHDEDLFDDALDSFRKCECRNLRVIRKCFQHSGLFRTRFETLDAEIRRQLLNQVVLLSCLFYQCGQQIDFNKLDDFNIYELYMERKEQEPTEGQTILKKVGFLPTQFDDIIIQYLKTGILDPAKSSQLLEHMARSTKATQIMREFGTVMGSIRGNFQGSPPLFIERITEFLETHGDHLSWNDIQNAVATLKWLGFDGDLSNWTDNYIVKNASGMTLENCNEFLPFAVSDAAKEALSKRVKAILGDKSTAEKIFVVMKNRGINPEDIAALNEVSVGEFKRCFSEEQSPELLTGIRELIKWFHPESEDKTWRSIGTRVFEALRQIAAEDAFAKKRITQFVGIKEDVLGKKETTEVN